MVRFFKALLWISLIGILLFSAYNFGFFGHNEWAREAETRARAAGEPYLLLCTAPDCLLSRELLDEWPAWEKRFRDLPVAVRVVRARMEREPDLRLAQERGVQVTPTILAMDGDGAEVARFAGRIDLEALYGLMATRTAP